MACQETYDEMMSLQLDGLLDAEDERKLLDHIAGCADCWPYWSAMRQADMLLVASAREPVPLPAKFTLKVLEIIAVTPVVRPQIDYVPSPAIEMVSGVSVMTPLVPAIGDYEAIPQLQFPEYVQEWHRRVGAYVRGMTAVGLTMALGIGLMLTLLISGALQVGGPVAPIVQATRTFVSAAWTWMRSLAANINSDALVAGGFVLALLAVVGWQIVSNYQRSTSQEWQETAEAAVAV